MNAIVQLFEHSLGIAFGIGMKTDLFQYLQYWDPSNGLFIKKKLLNQNQPKFTNFGFSFSWVVLWITHFEL